MSGSRTYDSLTWTTDSKASPAGPINGPRLQHMDDGIQQAYELASEKLTLQGDWTDTVDDYLANDVVFHNGRLYVASAEITDNSEPGTESPWIQLVAMDLDDLQNVALGEKGDGDVIYWNEDGGVWATKSLPDAGATELSALSDVALGEVDTDQVLRFDGSHWTNQALPSAPLTAADFMTYRSVGTWDSAPSYAVGDYVRAADTQGYVCISPSHNNNPDSGSSPGEWAVVPQSSPILLSSTDSLQGANPASAQTPACAGSMFMYSVGGAFHLYIKNDGRDFAWSEAMVAGTHLNVGNGVVIAEDNDGTLATVALTSDASQYLDGTGAFSTPAGGSATTSLSQLTDDVALNALAQGDILVYDHTAGEFKNQQPVAPGATALSGLSDVTETAQSTGQVLWYNGTRWVNHTLAVGATALSGLSDVTETALATNDILRWNGTHWVNIPIPAQALSALSDVTETSLATNDILKWNGTHWVNVPVPTAGATALSGLSDVALATPAAGQHLYYDGAHWINEPVRAQVPETATATLATVKCDTVYTCSNTITLTLPQISAQRAVGILRLTFKNISTAVITIQAFTGETIDGSFTKTIGDQYGAVDLVPPASGTDWMIV